MLMGFDSVQSTIKIRCSLGRAPMRQYGKTDSSCETSSVSWAKPPTTAGWHSWQNFPASKTMSQMNLYKWFCFGDLCHSD